MGPPTAPVGCWLRATSRSAPRSTSTTGCSPSTLATPIGASSLTPTSCPAPAPATSPRHPLTLSFSFLFPQTTHPSPKIPQPTVTEENHGPHVVLVENHLPYLFLFIFCPKNQRTSHLLALAPKRNCITSGPWSGRLDRLNCDKSIAIFVVRVAVS